MRFPLALSLLALLSLPTWATTINPVYGTGADDSTPVAPLLDNPGRTLGDQRKFVHEHVLKLAERVVWLPDESPIFSLVSWEPLAGFCARAFPVHPPRQDDDLGIMVSQPYWLEVLEKKRTPPSGSGGTFFEIQYSDKRVSLSLDPAHRGQVSAGLHEVIHLLGFSGANPFKRGGAAQRIGRFDLHLRLGDDSTPPWQMTDAMLAQADMAGADLRWTGTQTSVKAPALLTAGHVGGQVSIDAESPAHLSYAAVPDSLMEPSAAGTLELGIVAYMLSDLGWGPVVDSQVEASVSSNEMMAPTMTAMVTVDAGATNLVVTATLPEDLQSSTPTATPAACMDVNTARELVCTYTSLTASASIQYELSGTRGLYEVEMDVDHQDNHVDPRPVNNFATVEVAIGANTIEAVSLSPAAVAEARPAGTEVGRLGVTSAVGTVTHTYELAEGGRHNACFRVEDDKLLTAKPFDREGASSLNLRVLAKASNGFTREQDFTVEVTAAGSAATGWTWSTAAHAGIGGMAALNARTLALAALLLACAGASMAGAGKRPSLARRTRWAAALLAVLLAASCGGGGGGSGGGSSPAEPGPPPAPAFTC